MGRRVRTDAWLSGFRQLARLANSIPRIRIGDRLLIAAGVVSMLCGAWPTATAAAPAQEATAGPGVVINEVLYDPPGKDAGLEFVEVFNASATTVRLAGWKIETGNGSYANRWTLEWTGGVADSIGARCFFVVGEEAVAPGPNAVVDLDLQNGPDACRLVSPHGSTDVVGWGEHVYGEYYEGEPAEAAGSGLGLGRDPDGDDSDNNAADFIELDWASPGDFNHPPCDLAILKAGMSRYAGPSSPDLDVACVIQNLGTEACGSGATVRAALGAVGAGTPMPAPVAPAGLAKVIVRLPNPGAGLHCAQVWLECDADRRRANDSLTTTIVVPPPPLVINEVMFRPAGGDCEWLEIVNRSSVPLSLAAWHLADSGGRLRTVTSGDLVLDGGDFLVLVEDPTAFAATYGGSSGDSGSSSSGIVSIKPEGGWPNLNDADGPLGFADALVLKDLFGTTVDSVVYCDGWSKPGVSIERIDPGGVSTAPSNWSPHYGSSPGSPGAPNSVTLMAPPAEGMLGLSPASFTPDGDGRDDLVAISVRVPDARAVRLSVFDVNGRLVRRLIDGETVNEKRITFWDGARDDGSRAPTGMYIVGLEAGEAAGRGGLRAKAAVVLTGR